MQRLSLTSSSFLDDSVINDVRNNFAPPINKQTQKDIVADQYFKTYSTQRSTEFLSIVGAVSKNRLYLSNMPMSLSNDATYAVFNFLGKPEQNLQFEHASTKDIDLKFNLLATQEIDSHKNYTKIKNNRWHAEYIGATNEMTVLDIMMCSNWLMSLSKPRTTYGRSSIKAVSPEIIYLNVPAFLSNTDSNTMFQCVVGSATKTVIEDAGYVVDRSTARGTYYPKCIEVHIVLRPVFDLTNVPFAKNIQRGEYNL